MRIFCLDVCVSSEIARVRILLAAFEFDIALPKVFLSDRRKTFSKQRNVSWELVSALGVDLVQRGPVIVEVTHRPRSPPFNHLKLRWEGRR